MSLTDLVPPGQPQCGATPQGKSWPVCARPPDHHAGKWGRHESADFMWNDRDWLAVKRPGTSAAIAGAEADMLRRFPKADLYAPGTGFSWTDFLPALMAALHPEEKLWTSLLSCGCWTSPANPDGIPYGKARVGSWLSCVDNLGHQSQYKVLETKPAIPE